MGTVEKATELLSEHNIRQIAENLRTSSPETIALWRDAWARMLDAAADELVEIECEARVGKMMSDRRRARPGA